MSLSAKLIAALLLCVVVHDAIAQAQNNAANYRCSCDGVRGECLCPSSSPPNGIAPRDMPQFIVVTNDDAVTSVTEPVVRSITSDAHRNPNGCPVPATFFVSAEYSEPQRISRLYEDGHEIATHTLTHVREPDAREVGGARDWIVNEAGVPRAAVQGFRSPFLLHTPETRTILHRLGFRYDSSITEQASPASGTSPSETELVFPYTLHAGVAQNCAIGTGVCRADERYANMWEVPMWLIEDDAGTPVASMDLRADVDAFAMYKLQFDRRYNSNRAPLGIFLHASLVMAGQHGADINRFFRYALQHDDVWFVTNAQLLDFMAAPMTASQYREHMTRERQCGRRVAFEDGVWQRIDQPMYSPGLQTSSPTIVRDPITWQPTAAPTPSVSTAPQPINEPNMESRADTAAAASAAVVAGLAAAAAVLLV